jgi:outer membrane protein assembly factor BamA
MGFRVCVCVLILLVSLRVSAQTDTSTVMVRHIVLVGNKKTRPYIILRELPFQVGDRLPVAQLGNYLQKAHDRLMNIFLFIDIVPGIMGWKDGAVDIVLDVRERWYIFPIPYLKIIDRNFNQWWVEEDHSLQRVDYGVHFSWYNITGRNDKMHVYLESGYNRLVSLAYESPYLDRGLRQFISVSGLYNNAKQVNFATDSNKQVFFPDTTHLEDHFIHRTLQGSIAYNYRIGVTQRHTVQFTYTNEQLSDTINLLAQTSGYAPYFAGGRTRISYPELSYTYFYQGADYIPYPLKGFTAYAQLDNKGLGLTGDMNLWTLTLRGGYYRPLARKTFLAVEGQVIAKTPAAQPYVNEHLMGFGGMYLEGLEYYIIDGSFGALGRVTLRRQVLDHKFPTIFKNSRLYGDLPIRAFLNAYVNVGYVAQNGPEFGSFLNNRLLYTEGIGLDLVTIYDLQLKVEFSWNQLGKSGLFLHNYKGF